MGIFDVFKREEEDDMNINRFVQGSIANQVGSYKSQNTEYNSTPSNSGFVQGSIANSGSSQRLSSKELDSSNGLYNLAVQNGLQGKADSIMKEQSGEDTKEIFSGGFISDIFDTLNAAQFGVVGMLKGKTFSEGVKSRESFTDDDALGDLGIPGLILGTALDIVVDPFTWISPWKLLGKIPAVAKVASKANAKVFGKLVPKAIETADGVKKTIDTLKGGTAVGKFMARKFTWLFGFDPVYKEVIQREAISTAVNTKKVIDLVRPITEMNQDIAKKMLMRNPDDANRIARVPLEGLKGMMSGEEFGIIKKASDKIDELGQQLVDLGVLSEGKYKEGVNSYLKNVYKEYEEASVKKTFGASVRSGIKNKSRKKVADVAEFGLTQIDDPGYVVFKTLLDMTKDVEQAKMFKEVAEKFGTDVAQEGFSLIPKTGKFTTTGGKQAELLTGVKKINTDIKPLLKELKHTFKADKKVLKEIADIEKDLGVITKLGKKELNDFLNINKVVSEVKDIPQKLGTIPNKLKGIAESIKKADNFETFYKSADGIKLEQLALDGTLQRSGFTGKLVKGDFNDPINDAKKFFDTVKNPYKKATTKTVEKTVKGSTSELVKIQKKLDKLFDREDIAKTIDKTGVDDSFINLEKNINDLRFSKEDLLEELDITRMGDLAGKYVPDNIKENIVDMVAPVKNGIERKIVGNFKFFKVVMNPATHARNVVSNKLLNWWKLGMNPADPRVIKSDLEALGEITKKGGKWIDEATPLGYGMDTMAANEMRDIFSFIESSGMNKGLAGWKKIQKSLGDIYQGEENAAKLSAYIFNRKKGIIPEEAWKAAESATFNYAQVTPFIRKLRESVFGMPFITFTTKATPVVAETILKHPNRISVIGKIKNNIEKLSDTEETAKERANEPSWVKDGFYIKLPMKDKNGRSAYFDLTYILPFGDLISGNFLERGQDISEGGKEGIAQAVLKKSPFIQLVSQLGKNKDFYGNSIWKSSDDSADQLKDVMRHVTKTYVPPLVGDQIPGGYNSKGEQQQRGIVGAATRDPETLGQKRNLMQELMRNVGAKVQPIDADIQENYTEWNKKKALQNLLLENGIGTSFDIYNQPKK